MADPLSCLRAACSVFEEEPLKLVQLRSSDGLVVENISDAQQIALQTEQDAPEVVFEKDAPTRVMRARNVDTEHKDSFSPESDPDQFFTLAALVFAVQQCAERAGAYMRSANAAQIMPLPALERPAILEYLMGKRDALENVFIPDAAHAKTNTAQADAVSAPSEQPGAAPQSKEDAAVVTRKRAYVPDVADAEFVRQLRTKYEVVLLDRNDALKGTLSLAGDADGNATPCALGDGTKVGPTPTDVFGLRAMLVPRLEIAKKKMGSSKSTQASQLSQQRGANAPSNVRKTRAQDPIILLSNSPTALVNMFNVKALLQDGLFVPPEEARRNANGVSEPVITIQTRSEDDSANTSRSQPSRRVLVVDNAEAVNRLGSGMVGSDQDPWNRVIAVFTTGQTWQFKGYRWSDPRDLFRHAMGVYVRWNNEAPNPQIRDWNVTDLQLAAFFWRTLDNWVQRKKPRMQL
ncbi:Cdc73p [Malassezia vespertilionis]|uniref:Cdc73p n=1 Tax=Malassezia vespertilionis TaxID=2020962 RepID=A0A2N1J8X2_9BASI|nr:Cdc73p [Malassezia vespertilionis]